MTKLNAAGTALLYSTYLGGISDDRGQSIVIDDAGNAYVTGLTASNNFPTTPGAFQTTRQGAIDAFVTKLNAAGTTLLYSTYLGGSSDNQGQGIAIDDAGNAYVTGDTQSNNFPTTPGAFQTTRQGAINAFVTKFDCADPTIICPDPITVGSELNLDGSNVTYEVTAMDDGGILSITCDGQTTFFPPGTSTAMVTETRFFPIGTTTVTCTAEDNNGFTASCSFDVIVIPSLAERHVIRVPMVYDWTILSSTHTVTLHIAPNSKTKD